MIPINFNIQLLQDQKIHWFTTPLSKERMSIHSVAATLGKIHTYKAYRRQESQIHQRNEMSVGTVT